MSGVDILLLFTVIVALFVGFFKGMLKIGIAIGALYASIALAGLYHRFLAEAMNPGTPMYVRQMISFFALLFTCFFILYFAGSYTFRYVKVGGRIQYLDKFIGAFLGLILGGMIASILAMILRYSFVQNDAQAGINYPLTRGIARSTQNSVLRDIFVQRILPIIYTPVSPLLPASADQIFRQFQ